MYRVVRLAALEDTPSAFGSTYEAESRRSEKHWVERVVAGSRGSARATFFAEDEGGVVVGLVGGYRVAPSDERVELVSMWTVPTHRRRGVGRALVEAVTAWAEETGGTHVGLWVTRGNTAAENLYQAMGFMPTGERQPLPSDPSKDEVRMDRSLR